MTENDPAPNVTSVEVEVKIHNSALMWANWSECHRGFMEADPVISLSFSVALQRMWVPRLTSLHCHIGQTQGSPQTSHFANAALCTSQQFLRYTPGRGPHLVLPT